MKTKTFSASAKTFAASCRAPKKEVSLQRQLLLTEKKEGVARRRSGLRPKLTCLRERDGKERLGRSPVILRINLIHKRRNLRSHSWSVSSFFIIKEKGAARRRGIVHRNRDSYGTAEGAQKLQPVSYAVHNLK